MNSEHPEYNRDTNPYPSFGKKYNSERAIISLTSWKARINTVSKTLYSLLTQCKGFHIVLVLSEEEFPKMMDELPDDLKLFVDNELIEILWIYKNYKSLKKWLFTQDKYKDVPIISADDDCIYTCNYAKELYDMYLKYPNCIITMREYILRYRISGPSALYYPYCFGKDFSIHDALSSVNYKDYEYVDDAFIEFLRCKYKDSKIICIKKRCFTFHDEIEPMHDIYNKGNYISNLRRIQSRDAGKNIFSTIKE